MTASRVTTNATRIGPLDRALDDLVEEEDWAKAAVDINSQIDAITR